MRGLFALAFAGVGLLSISSVHAATYAGSMSGANEVPPNVSTATGFTTVTITGDTLTVDLTFSGLTNIATAGHIHCCTPVGTNAIVAIPFVGLPAALSGTYSNTFDLTLAATYNGAFITANGGTVASAEAALLAGLAAGQAYSNLHDAPNFNGGEIRANLVAVPESASWLLMIVGFGLLGAAVQRRASLA